MEKIKNKSILKLIFILLSISFAVPSITYMLKGGKIENLISSFTFFYTKQVIEITPAKVYGTILFTVIFIGIAYAYYKIIKNRKNIFANNKNMAIFITTIAIIFLLILPLTSTDIFYYIGTGWSEAHYGVNPYYTSVKELMQTNELARYDVMLQKMVGSWDGQTIVYGPIWPLVCRILSGLSMGNLFLALLIYKLFNLCLHLINTFLIHKITKGKSIFTLAYGLNPLVLFDGIVNVHNEILVIFFILLAIYFFIRKKNMFFTVVFFACATAVKYFAILLIPFIVIYHYRKEKILKKVLYSCLWAILFIAVITVCYLIYMRDFSVLNGIITQQGKYANSLLLCIAIKNINMASTISKGLMLAFIIIYITTIIKLLFEKKIHTFSYYMREYNLLLILFIFGVITNFQTWYTLWLLPTLIWQNSKNIRWIICINIMVEIANIVFFILCEHYIYQVQYFIIMITLIIISNIICGMKNIGGTNEKNRKKQSN